MIDRLKENWDAIKDTLKENYDISKVSYDTWIVPMEIHNVDNDQVYILADTKGIPNILDYIKKKYKQILEIVIEEKIGLHCNVIFVTSEDLEKRPNLTAEASNIVYLTEYVTVILYLLFVTTISFTTPCSSLLICTDLFSSSFVTDKSVNVASVPVTLIILLILLTEYETIPFPEILSGRTSKKSLSYST